jgi:Ca-activated chloride channel family protein
LSPSLPGFGSGPPGTDGAFGLDHPQVLFLLIPLFFFALVRVIWDRKYSRLMAPFALRYRFSRFLSWVFYGALIFALAGPHWGIRQMSEYRWGLDVVLALDLSHSMEVRDLESSRLERAAALGKELAELPGFRLACALGRGRGSLAVPLTEDRPVILSLLESLDRAIYTGAGTDLESLVDAAASAFLDDFPSRRIIVLFSDGEALSGSLAAAARRARALNIAIVAVGLGTGAGGPVPGGAIPGGVAAAPDAGEDLPVSRLHRKALEEAAELTGGIYIDGADPLTGSRLGTYLESLASEREGGSRRRENRPRWRLFLCTALIALAFSKMIMRRFVPRVRALALVFLVPLLYPSCAPVSGKLLVMEANFYYSQGRYDEAIEVYTRALEKTEGSYAEYGLGTVYVALEEISAARGRYDAALETYQALPAGEHGELGYRIHYNRGLVLFWEGDFEGAAKAFREALEIDGSRIEAKRNLEISLLSLSRERDREGRGNGESQGEEAELDPRLNALFLYLGRKEQDQWKSREWAEEPPFSGPDY